ncbi:hypothetical protein G6045_27295 [Streptomyces sp. YC504]|uniref:F5/8 type C domain-containing protein n=1 Tax=Streptomyces mesophilus TaxID=1775132 RepID=A0A6G4XRU7_9ACTN|nr:hypothetical protein [Streptomyces mesophilus]NGO79331.1 hypothetical protein [Streptomyces mesophilus]
MKKILVPAAGAALALAVTATTAAGAPKPLGSSVVLSASPSSLSANELPCLPGKFDVSMTNTGDASVFADTLIGAERPLTLSDDIFSSYLPAADPDRPVSRSVRVGVPRGTAPGVYDVTLTSGKRRVVVPVTVTAVPEPAPGANLAYGQQATASSTHGSFSVCGAVDGDSTYANWARTGWNDGTRTAFPDWLAVQWPEPVELGRIETVTYGAPGRPATQGIKDFDVQVKSGGDWLTVGTYRGNTVDRVVTAFDPVTTDAVRVLVHASNSGDYSRLLEVEAYAPQ